MRGVQKQNYDDNKKSQWYPGVEGIRDAQMEYRAVNFKGSENTVYNTIKMDGCRPLYICRNSEYMIPKINCNVNYGFLEIMMCQPWLISCNKCICLAKDVDNERDYEYVGGEGIWGKPCTQFCCEP